MNENPWCRLPDRPPYVLPEDALDVQVFNAKVGKDHDHFLNVDAILPEPFVGAPKAPVVLLSNNPGFREEGLPLRQNPVFLDKMRKNLLHKRSDYPFTYLAPDLSGPGKQWWESKLKRLLGKFGHETVARSILNIVYFPYPSRKYGHGRLRLPSQDYSFGLVRDAVNRKAVIVSMRKKERWLNAVNELKGYDRLCQVQNVRNPVISPRNCDRFEEVVQAIAEAETKRQGS